MTREKWSYCNWCHHCNTEQQKEALQAFLILCSPNALLTLLKVTVKEIWLVRQEWRKELGAWPTVPLWVFLTLPDTWEWEREVTFDFWPRAEVKRQRWLVTRQLYTTQGLFNSLTPTNRVNAKAFTDPSCSVLSAQPWKIRFTRCCETKKSLIIVETQLQLTSSAESSRNILPVAQHLLHQIHNLGLSQLVWWVWGQKNLSGVWPSSRTSLKLLSATAGDKWFKIPSKKCQFFCCSLTDFWVFANNWPESHAAELLRNHRQ